MVFLGNYTSVQNEAKKEYSEGDDAESLVQQAANPLADLMSFPFQNNLNINSGPYDRNINVLNI
jgi:hypothetical protein